MFKLLIADDEQIVIEGIKDSINWIQYDIEVVGTAKNGTEALKLAQELQPDIIISDIKMPGLNGLELIEELKAINGGQNEPCDIIINKDIKECQDEINKIIEKIPHLVNSNEDVTQPDFLYEILNELDELSLSSGKFELDCEFYDFKVIDNKTTFTIEWIDHED